MKRSIISACALACLAACLAFTLTACGGQQDQKETQTNETPSGQSTENPTAEAGIDQLKFDTEYTKYDFTGDGQPDTFKAVTTEDNDMFVKCDITINGKVAYTYNDSFYPGEAEDTGLTRITLDDGKIFVGFTARFEDGDSIAPVILGYSDGKMEVAADLLLKNFGNHCSTSIKDAAGQTVTVHYDLMSYTMGSISFDMPFNASGASFASDQAVVSFTSPLVETDYGWTASDKIDMYSTNACEGDPSASIAKGASANVSELFISADRQSMSFHAKVKGGKEGWFKALADSPESGMGLFKEAMLAG